MRQGANFSFNSFFWARCIGVNTVFELDSSFRSTCFDCFLTFFLARFFQKCCEFLVEVTALSVTLLVRRKDLDSPDIGLPASRATPRRLTMGGGDDASVGTHLRVFFFSLLPLLLLACFGPVVCRAGPHPPRLARRPNRGHLGRVSSLLSFGFSARCRGTYIERYFA